MSRLGDVAFIVLSLLDVVRGYITPVVTGSLRNGVRAQGIKAHLVHGDGGSEEVGRMPRGTPTRAFFA